MINDVIGMVVVAAVGTVVWLTIGRTMMKVAAAASEIRVGPGLRLLDHPSCVLRDVRVVEVVAYRNDLLVGFAGGHGSWYRHDEPGRAAPVVIDDQVDVAGQLCFPAAAHDTRARRLLDTWRTEGQDLTAVINDVLSLGALIDESSREALTVDLACFVP